MTTQPIARISEPDLGTLLSTLEVEVVALSECVVSPGFALDMGAVPVPGIHYSIAGEGRMIIRDKTVVDMAPHTLIVVPPSSPFRLESAGAPEAKTPLRIVDGRAQRSQEVKDGAVRRFSAGDASGGLILVCGFFRAFYGSTVEIFGDLPSPIVERFDRTDKLDAKLKDALAELVAEEIGSNAMSAALLKQVIIALLRRALLSSSEWVERFALLRDPNITRVFADMAARPGAGHSIESLAHTACLSRSAFMSRFSDLLGRPPMEILRDLRMRQAAKQLKAGLFTVDQVARDAGYMSRSSFARAFAKTYGRDPTSAVGVE